MAYIRYLSDEFYLPEDTEQGLPVRLALWINAYPDNSNPISVGPILYTDKGGIISSSSTNEDIVIYFDAQIQMTSPDGYVYTRYYNFLPNSFSPIGIPSYVARNSQYEANSIVGGLTCHDLPASSTDWNAEYIFTCSYVRVYDSSINIIKGKANDTFAIKYGQIDDSNVQISGISDFDNTSFPVITYSCGDIAAFEVAITDADGDIIVNYKSIPVNQKTYQYPLTAEDYSALGAVFSTGLSYNFTFISRYQKIGESEYRPGPSVNGVTYTLVGANPELAPTVVDTNATTLALTGDENVLIKFHSSAKCSINATAMNGATFVKRSVTNNNKTEIIPNGGNVAHFYNVENNKFIFYASDSRNLTTTQTVTQNMIEYIKPTVYVESITPPSVADPRATIIIKGNRFKGSFGAVDNTLTIQYRYKLSSASEFSDWATNTQTITTITTSVYQTKIYIANLDYNAAYITEIKVSDKLETFTLENVQIVSLPVFDWSRNDFNFNVPVTMTDTATDTVYNLLGLIKSVTEPTQLTPQYSTSSSGGWSTFELSNAYLIGNTLHVDLYAKTGSSVAAGTATTVIGNAIIAHGGRIAAAPATITFCSGKGSPPATLYTQSHSVTSSQFKFTIIMCATSGTTNTINAHLAIPVVINTNAFIK